MAGLDLRHVENIIDDVEQEVAARMDVVDILLIAVGTERTECACLNHFRETDDRVERRTQLMGHIGEEF